MSTLHDRMPVVLHPDDYGAWLGEEPAPAPELKALLRPYDGELKIWPLSPHMNRADDSEGPEVIEPLRDDDSE